MTATTKGTRRAAERELAEFVARIDYPRRMTAETTVSKLLEDWYRAMSPNWSPTTARQTRSVIDCHLVPGLGDVRLQTLRAEHIDAFYGELRRGGGRNGEPLSPGTVHRVHVVLHRALAQALRWEWLWVNPAASASPPSCEPAPIYPPSPEEVVRLLAAVAGSDPDFHTFLALAAVRCCVQRRLDGPIGSTWTATASSCSSLTTRERGIAPTAPT